MKTIKLSVSAQQELYVYKLTNNADYLKAVDTELLHAEASFKKYNYYVSKSTANKNMLKALRMMPSLNTPQDWARLHITEALFKLK